MDNIIFFETLIWISVIIFIITGFIFTIKAIDDEDTYPWEGFAGASFIIMLISMLFNLCWDI